MLSYLHSCIRETITGGVVTVGIDQSEVQAGKVTRTKLDCGESMFRTIPKRRAHQGRNCGAAEIQRFPENVSRWADVSKSVRRLPDDHGCNGYRRVQRPGTPREPLQHHHV
jgi:hypothetical protein